MRLKSTYLLFSLHSSLHECHTIYLNNIIIDFDNNQGGLYLETPQTLRHRQQNPQTHVERTPKKG